MPGTLTPQDSAASPSGFDRPLAVADRCDRCRAQAFVRVTVTDGELEFCGHHYAKHQDAIAKVAVYVHDERECLDVKRDSGFNV